MGAASQYVSQWLRHRTVLVEILDLVENPHANLKPFENAMSLSELAIHTAGVGLMFVNAVKQGTMVRPDSPPKVESMEDTRRIVRDLTEATKTAMESLTGEQIEGIVSATQTFGFDAPGKVFLHTMREHEIHHKGQMFVYAHLAGVDKLPFFINRNV